MNFSDLKEYFADLRVGRRKDSSPRKVARKKNKAARAARRITRVRDKG